MRKYKINYAELNSYNVEGFLTALECVCRYANFAEFPALEDALAIIGIVPIKEREEIMTEDDVEEILFGKKEEE